MPTTSERSVQDLRAQFEALLAAVLSDDARTLTADTMERHLLRQILALGRSLFALFLATRAAATAGSVCCGPDGVERPYHSQRARTVLCIFGRVVFVRPYFYRVGVGGVAPVDGQLSLPATACSDLVRETAEELGVEGPYHKGLQVLRRLLGLAVSTRLLAEQVREDGPEVEAFYAQQARPEPAAEAALLVVQADGKGVPILRPSPVPAPVRLGKGQKHGGKKEATLTGVYTIAPLVRTPEAVVESLFSPAPPPRTERSGPQHKRLRATLAGKEAALREAARQVAGREGPHLTHRVALTDGSKALQERVQRHFPTFTLVLDLIHATEYLWKAANALLGETHPGRTPWVKARTLLLLQSRVGQVVDDLRQLAQEPERTAVQAKVLHGVASYLERNAPFMQYATSLAEGWPIATGVIEGACRHLVKDRCEQSGMRWTIEGAEALLQLRSVQENGDWDAFHAFRRRQRHRRLYALPYPGDAPADLRALEASAPGQGALAA